MLYLSYTSGVFGDRRQVTNYVRPFFFKNSHEFLKRSTVAPASSRGDERRVFGTTARVARSQVDQAVEEGRARPRRAGSAEEEPALQH